MKGLRAGDPTSQQTSVGDGFLTCYDKLYTLG